jgi:proton-coupled amino acid transporter
VVAVNETGVLTMLGFAIYSYEGIGVVMPIMQSAESPGNFLKLLILAIGTLTGLYVIFGSVCYSAYGSETKPIITEMLPNNGFTAAIKILFCINLILGYSICIHPTNLIIETWVF